MKKLASLFFTITIILFFTGNSIAQEKAKMTITSVKQKGETVRFTITSSKILIFGGNRYVLYIGDQEFTMSDVPDDENNRIISFPLSMAEFRLLKEGAGIYLSYGRIDIEEHDMGAYARQNRKCWSLGKFSKTMLKK